MQTQVEKKLRVLECIRQGQIGGGESHLLSLVEHLDKDKFEPLVLSFTDGPMIDRLKAQGVETHVIHTVRPFDVSKWRLVKRYMKEKKIDLVHAHGTRANSNVLWAAKSLGIPVVYTVHGWSFHQDQSSLVRNFRIMGEKYLTSRADMNISVSRSNQLSGKKYLPAFDSVVVNNGIDHRKFNPDASFKDIRAELQIPGDAVLVLFIARFTAHKQPLALLKAFGEAVKRFPGMHLLMVGDGDQKKEATVILENMADKHKVTLLPFRQDVPDLLASADIFVLPSLWEGLPIGLLEAMAMGKAVIASNVDGTSEIVEDGRTGILIETAALEKNLEEALVNLAGKPDQRNFFSRNAINTVNERFNAAEMTRTIEQLYIKLTAENKSLQVQPWKNGI